MKNKIVSVLLLCTLFFSVFSVFVAAEDIDVLKEEMEKNFPNLDLDVDFSNNMRVVGAMEDFTDETCLYLYVHWWTDSESFQIENGYLNLNCRFESFAGVETTKSFDKIAFSVVSTTNDKKFVKIRIDLFSIASVISEYGKLHEYFFEGLSIKHKGFLRNSYYKGKNCWKFDYSDNESPVKVSYEVAQGVELDVYHTYYRTPSATSEVNVFDEIHTVYFSIPEEYTKYYSKLYSVASTYTKKKTTPMLIGTAPLDNLKNHQVAMIYSNNSMLSSDYVEHEYNIIPGNRKIYYSDTAYNMLSLTDWPSVQSVHYHNFDKIGYYFYCDKEIKKPEDLKVAEEEFFEYVYYCQENVPSMKLFSYSEDCPWSEKTINDTFDSISYYSQVKDNLAVLIETYGARTGFLLWWFRDNDAKIKELCEKYSVDVPLDFEDKSNLLLCDDQVREHANTLTEQEFSDMYLINIDDVPSFKAFLNNNKNVVLYRYDVVDYYSDEVVIGDVYDGAFHQVDVDFRYALVEMYAYFGFQVIDLTFSDEGSFISLAVNSHPQDFASDPGLEEDDLNNMNPDLFDDLFGDLKNKGTNLKNKAIQGLISAVIVVVSVLIICIGVSSVIKGTFSVSFRKKDKNKKNE